MTSSLEKRVLEITRGIPRNRASTYREIVKKLGNKNLARVVGNALHKNSYSSVPCHRVICSDGSVGGFARGTLEKIKLLVAEGVTVVGRRINLQTFVWFFEKGKRGVFPRTKLKFRKF